MKKVRTKIFLNFYLKFSISPVPASEALLLHFVASLARAGVTYGSVCSYLAAIQHLYIFNGYSDPSLVVHPCLEYVIKSLWHTAGIKPWAKRLPITPEILLENPCSMVEVFIVWYGPALGGFLFRFLFCFVRAGRFACSSQGSAEDKGSKVQDISNGLSQLSISPDGSI